MKNKFKLLSTLCLLILFILIISGCDKKKLSFEEINPFTDGLASVKINGSYGFINEDKDIVIEPSYELASHFINGYSIVKKNNAFGVIDTAENIIIPFEYKSISYIDKLNYFQCVKSLNYILVDTSNNLIADLGTSHLFNISQLNENHTVLTLCNNDMSKFGFYDLNTDFFIEPKYEQVYVYSDEAAYATFSNYDKTGQFIYGYANLDTKHIVEPKYNTMLNFINGISPVKVDNKFGYMNDREELILEPKFQDAYNFIGDLASVKFNGKYGCINPQGNFAIEPKFLSPIHFFNGIIATTSNEEGEILINKKGEALRDIPSFNGLTCTKSDFFILNYNDKDQVPNTMALDGEGNILFSTSYENIYFALDELGQVSKLGKYGYISKRGIEIIPPIYDDIFPFQNLFLVNNKGFSGIIDEYNKEVLPLEYDNIGIYNNSILFLEKDGKFGFYNIDTKKLTEPIYDDLKTIYSKDGVELSNFTLDSLQSTAIDLSKYSMDYSQRIDNIFKTTSNTVPVKKADKWFYITP